MMTYSINDNFSFKCCGYPPFKEVHGLHYNWNRSPISRSLYKIVDLELWFKSDFEEGGELVVKRISENGKYNFSKHLKVF